MRRRKIFWRAGLFFAVFFGMAAAFGAGCGRASGGKRIVRIALGQSESHPEYLGLLAFKEHVEQSLGDRYEVQIFPNEILGATQRAIELTQTGAIDFVVAGTANLETFADVYEVFSMPYLFDSPEVYRTVMSDETMMNAIYESTDRAGFRVLTWYNAGTRNFYAKKPVYGPEDLKGMKIRVQQSPASVKMVQAFGAAASPMSFGEVYTAIQQGVIDGAENNELALTNNKHGEVAKYFTYNMHQMVPDMLVGNLKFLNSLTEEELEVFREAARRSNEIELAEWDRQVEEAKETARTGMGVEFLQVDTEAFKERVLSLHEEMLAENPDIVEIYQEIQKVNQEMKEGRNQDGPEMGKEGTEERIQEKIQAGTEKDEIVNERTMWAEEAAWTAAIRGQTMPQEQRMSQKPPIPQSAMEAGGQMRWRKDWELMDSEEEWTWTE